MADIQEALDMIASSMSELNQNVKAIFELLKNTDKCISDLQQRVVALEEENAKIKRKPALKKNR